MKKYTRSGEWTGYSVHKSAKGFVVEYWARIQGEPDGDKWLITYPYYKMNRDTNLAEDWNDTMSRGDFIAQTAREQGRCLRRGRVVR